MSTSTALNRLLAERPDLDGTPTLEVAFPGPLRDRLVQAYLDGHKQAGSGLLVQHEHDGDPVPEVGDRWILIDSVEAPVAVLRITRVDARPFGKVDDDIARAEGEGFASAAEWRDGHRAFWTSPGFRRAIDDPSFTPDDHTMVVVSWVQVLELVGTPNLERVTVQEVERSNVRALCELKLAHGQEHLVAPAAYTIAEGLFEPGALLRAFFRGDRPVAVALVEVEFGTPHIVRFMVDAAAQGQGIGCIAVATLLAELTAVGYRHTEVSFVPTSGGSEGFWRRCGFSDTGRVEDGEPVFSTALT